ncbi:amidohydrolase family protein [Glutamicibacter arilaitensis]|uniref:amidohydrolase family protein n=1 Tax=Glutamicibacter arilaitensis TaxID=256701 RepID=UPI003A8CA193
MAEHQLSGQAGTGPSDDAALPAYLQALGIPGLIDLHVHFMPQNVLDKVWAFFDSAGERSGVPWPINYRLGEAQRVAKLRELGVIAYGTLNYAHRPSMAAWLNAYSRDFAAGHPEAIRSGTFYPEPGVTDLVREAIADGVEVFKVHVQVGGFTPLDPQLDQAWELLAEARTPVVIHCGNGPHRGEFTGIEPIRELIARHPELVLVIAHAGLPDYLQFAQLAAEHPNVYLDTTMVGTGFMNRIAPLPEDYPQVVAGLGHKIVLGSDFPNIPYSYSHQIQALAAWGLGGQWMREVLHDTPLKLLQAVRNR